MSGGTRKKLVLAVIDSLKPEMLGRAIAGPSSRAIATICSASAFVCS